MGDRFVIKGLDNQLHTYDDFDLIPQEFFAVIEFAPELPSPPHTQEDHDRAAVWNGKLQELMRRERACRQRRESEMRTSPTARG